jgi:3-dehydroquinate synthase
MKEIKVQLSSCNYSIFYGSEMLSRAGSILKEFDFERQCAVITDESVSGLYSKNLIEGLEDSGFNCTLYKIPPGEGSKTMNTALSLLDDLTEDNFNRHTPLLALGGGVISDLAGFVASIYMRGMPLIQLPTTLLAQLDSSVGGKVGVNHPSGKNMIGAFYQPNLVLTDLDTLKTVPERDMTSGFAEVIKYGMILDKELFEYLEENHGKLLKNDSEFLEHIVSRCCELKRDVVEQDERDEKGIRAVLNYGHTLGHALEAATNYERFLHGEAVALGMAYAARLSHRLKYMELDEVSRQNNLQKSAGLKTVYDNIDADELIKMMYYDKKRKKVDKIRFIITEGIGLAKLIEDVTPSMIKEILSEPEAA